MRTIQLSVLHIASLQRSKEFPVKSAKGFHDGSQLSREVGEDGIAVAVTADVVPLPLLP